MRTLIVIATRSCPLTVAAYEAARADGLAHVGQDGLPHPLRATHIVTGVMDESAASDVVNDRMHAGTITHISAPDIGDLWALIALDGVASQDIDTAAIADAIKHNHALKTAPLNALALLRELRRAMPHRPASLALDDTTRSLKVVLTGGMHDGRLMNLGATLEPHDLTRSAADVAAEIVAYAKADGYA